MTINQEYYISQHDRINVLRALEDVQAYNNATSQEELQQYRFEKYLSNDQGDTYPWYEKTQSFYDAMQEKFPGVFIMKDGGSIPYEATGFIGKYAFYARLRGGYASLRVFPSINKEDRLEDLLEQGYRGMFYGTDTRGEQQENYSSAKEVTQYADGQDVNLWEYLIDNLAVTPFAYEFHTVDCDPEEYVLLDPSQETVSWNMSYTTGIADKPDTRIQYSHRREDAYSMLCSKEYNPHFYLIDAQYADPEPINYDTRVFPDPLPDFSKIARRKPERF